MGWNRDAHNALLCGNVFEADLPQVKFILAFVNLVISGAVYIVEIHMLLSPESLSFVSVLDSLGLHEELPFLPRELAIVIKVVGFEHRFCDPFVR